ncbi:hypothetical protein [Plantactinospora sp. WMMB782]|uniref:hypothetical protein n=1 Tax=Plantactinospora sp. WMMB782 TaxID=3404121 RepID=UPI003B92C3EE
MSAPPVSAPAATPGGKPTAPAGKPVGPKPVKSPGKPTAGSSVATLPATSDKASSPPPRSAKRTWQLIIGSLGVLLMLGICGLSSYFFMVDEPVGRDSRAADGVGAAAAPRDISSRAVDPVPLTVKEVFPGKEVQVDPEQTPYELLKTQEAEDCDLAADGQIATVLRDAGCSQFVRGTVRSPTGLYVATAGIVNLTDEAAATAAREKIKPIVDGRKGRFLGLAAGRGTEAVTAASAQAGWHVRGHFLIYCVVAKSDGKTIGEEDLFARQILSDMIEVYLRGKVLDQRIIAPSGQPSPGQ